MLRLVVGSEELFDNRTNQFFYTPGTILELEHSLASISKWEQIWKVPFLSDREKTAEEIYSYVACMSINDCSEEIVKQLTEEHFHQIERYIQEPMTAATFKPKGKKNNGEFITAETIYYMMTAYNIPFECQYWHFNRLTALIQMCSAKNESPKKMPMKEVIQQQQLLNKARRKALEQKGGR